MALSVFALIQRYFSAAGAARTDVALGVGDDAALVCLPEGHSLAVSVALLLEGRHFTSDTPSDSLGHTSLAVTLSRLAASGAEPAWFTLALTLPHADTAWLDGFSRGLQALAARYNVQLIGGDTTRGPRQIVVHSHGLVPSEDRNQPPGPHPGDLVYVTGDLGLAGLALLARQGEVVLNAADLRQAEQRLAWPDPRVKAGHTLRGLVSGMTDLPDGLASGLYSILSPYGVGATLLAECLPVSPVLADHLDEVGGWVVPLTAGGDYELCFTLAPERQAEVEGLFVDLGLACTWIGTVERTPGVRCLRSDGVDIASGASGPGH